MRPRFGHKEYRKGTHRVFLQLRLLADDEQTLKEQRPTIQPVWLAKKN
jgi:hypothetical protein